MGNSSLLVVSRLIPDLNVNKFALKDMGPLNYFVAVEVLRI